MARRTLEEVNEALVSVRAAISAAETAKRYKTGLAQEKEMEGLAVLYRRENDLLDERSLLSGTATAGPVFNRGVISR